MNPDLVLRLAADLRAELRGTVVRRAVRLTDGIALVLADAAREHELAFVLPTGAAWGWTLDPRSRDRLAGEIETRDPDFVRAPVAGFRDPNATPLDALRAWLFRAAPGAGAWAQLEGAHVLDAEASSDDRIVEVTTERRDALGNATRMRVRAELFDQVGNVLLLDAAGNVLASYRDRPPAAARAPKPAVPSGAGSLLALAYTTLAANAARELQRAWAREARRDTDHLRRLLDKLAAEGTEADAAEHSRQDGELLAANLHRLKRGQARVSVEDWFAPGSERTIELDPKLSPQENLTRIFKRARRAERGRDAIAARRAEVEAKLDAARARLAAADTAGNWPETLRHASNLLHARCPRAAATTVPALWTPGGPGWTAATTRDDAPRDEGPGRRYALPGGWEARVGRSNADNDELTHRFAHPDDVWLHASGVPGSHVVLRMHGRSGNPPKDVLEIAAALAARFSKAKHAGTVPVVWTRKRYVRKPRGAPAGLAQCTHEKTVFVKPGLPAGESDPGDGSS